ncbi:rhodanese-like domain-containing protein [Argonema antarcticum]|uniref:rhodanese-like domain-containing protein n=1 Tax=Argonema antarcticum TaxID=2942763 RepID=UPI00308418FB
MENIQDKAQEAKNNISEGIQKAGDKVSDAGQTVKEKLSDDIKYSGDKVSEAILSAKEKMPNITPTPPGFKAQSSAHDLKSRLEWGEPAFTILDVRDREIFNDGHIMGAMPMPIDELVERAKPSIDLNRDIYVYADSDEQTSQAVNQLRSAGFEKVAELQGGLAAWKAIGGPTEGVSESRTPAGADDYNVVDRLKNHQSTKTK